MSLKEKMPIISSNEGVWEGWYRYYDIDGNKIDEHRSRLLCRFPWVIWFMAFGVDGAVSLCPMRSSFMHGLNCSMPLPYGMGADSSTLLITSRFLYISCSLPFLLGSRWGWRSRPPLGQLAFCAFGGLWPWGAGSVWFPA